MYAHNHDVPPDVRILRPDCPDELCVAIMRMLEKDPADRFPSMEAAVAAAGARPLTHDDPSRNQLIALAKTGLTHRIVTQARTPRSPIPLPSRRVPARIVRNPVVTGVVAASLMGVGFLASRLLTGERAVTPGRLTPPAPTTVAAADTQTVPLPTPSAPEESVSSNGQQPQRTAPPTVPQRQAVAVDRSAPTADHGRLSSAGGNTGRATSPPATVESTRVETPLKNDSTPTVPVLSPPPPVASLATGAPAPSPTVSRPATTPAEDVTAVIQSYARALAASNLEAARRIYPGMPNDQRQGLEALWRGGGTMSPTWTVSSIAIDGDVATAIVRGTNMVVAVRGQAPQQVPVALRARLEKRNNEWRLIALVN